MHLAMSRMIRVSIAALKRRRKAFRPSAELGSSFSVIRFMGKTNLPRGANDQTCVGISCLVLINALIVTNSRIVGKPEVENFSYQARFTAFASFRFGFLLSASITVQALRTFAASCSWRALTHGA